MLINENKTSFKVNSYLILILVTMIDLAKKVTNNPTLKYIVEIKIVGKIQYQLAVVLNSVTQSTDDDDGERVLVLTSVFQHIWHSKPQDSKTEMLCMIFNNMEKADESIHSDLSTAKSLVFRQAFFLICPFPNFQFCYQKIEAHT